MTEYETIEIIPEPEPQPLPEPKPFNRKKISSTNSRRLC